jgi:integrase
MAKRRGNHEGTISQRSSGGWQAQITIQGHRLSKTFPTQKDGRFWIKKMLEQVESGLSFTGARMTFGEYLTQWLENCKGTIRINTWHQYEGVVRNHLRPHLGSIRLSELQPNHIQRFYNFMVEHGLSRRTMQLIHSVTRRALMVGQRQGLIGRNPAQVVEPPRYIKKEMLVLSDTQARQLFITARGKRHAALYHLAITTGIRQGEMLGLKWNDVDWAGCVFYIKRQVQRVSGEGLIFTEPKTKAGSRLIQFGNETLRQLSAHRKRQDHERLQKGWQENDLIFPSSIGTPLDQRNLIRDFKALLIEANLPKIRFHDLRHTAATLMLLNGIPLLVVSRRLGHAKPSITLDIYGHYLPGMQSRAAALMDELVTPIAAQLQRNCSGEADEGMQMAPLTPYVAVDEFDTATYKVTHQGLEP